MSQKTALYDWHIAAGAKMVSFAGYEMPVQYPDGIMQEHLWTRTHSGLFDVSHMGQIIVSGGSTAEIALALEQLLPQDLLGLEVGQQRYALLLNEQGGIDDDLMLTRREKDFYVVVNAACKEADFAKLQAGLPNLKVEWWADRALLALQGPEAVNVLAVLNPAVRELAFMRGGEFNLLDTLCWVSRSGYTGEDGFEISVPNDMATELANALCADARCKPIGLGARDSLRLEAGLCLYGNDLTTETTPISAALLWAIQKVRRPDGERAGGYKGAEVIAEELAAGSSQKRVGLIIEGKMPVRAHSPIFHGDERVGEVTSGGFAPTLQMPVAMGYVKAELANIGTKLTAEVRGKKIPLEVVKMPFTQKNYAK